MLKGLKNKTCIYVPIIYKIYINNFNIIFFFFIAITYMKNLESLNVSKNHLKRLPLQLCECNRLNELNISDNIDIWHIPERISYMQSLQMLSADRKF